MLEWKRSLETGIGEIDNQHKEIFRRLSQLLEACHNGKGREEVGDTIMFLEEYTVMHFSTEEKHMAQKGYPYLDKHREQHQEFLASFANLKERWAKEGPGVHIVVLVNKTLGQWLVNHIMKTDKAWAQWLKEN